MINYLIMLTCTQVAIEQMEACKRTFEVISLQNSLYVYEKKLEDKINVPDWTAYIAYTIRDKRIRLTYGPWSANIGYNSGNIIFSLRF